MTMNSGGGNNWSGVLIALIGAISTLAVTWLTIQHSVSPGVSGTEAKAIAPAVLTSPIAPQIVLVPDLRSVSVAQAQEQLTALGLIAVVVNVPDQQPVGTVLSVNPQAGQTVTAGATIVLQVSTGGSASMAPHTPPSHADKRPKGGKGN